MQRLQHGKALGWVWSQPGGARVGSELSLQLFMGAAFPTSHSFELNVALSTPVPSLYKTVLLRVWLPDRADSWYLWKFSRISRSFQHLACGLRRVSLGRCCTM